MKPPGKTMRRTVRGFTLVEVMIAATLFSLVLTLVFSALYTGTRSWQAGEAQTETNDQYRIGMEFIRKYLSQALPLILVESNENNVLFKGEKDIIHFISPLPAHRGGGGLHLLSLLITEDDDEPQLSLLHQPAWPDIEIDDNLADDDVEEVVLLKGVEDIELSYFGRENAQEDPEWYDDWDNEQRLPEVISLSFVASDRKRYLPELLIPLHNIEARGVQFAMYRDTQNQRRSGTRVEPTDEE